MFDFGIKDIIDILLVATLLYQIYRLMKSSGSLNIFYGILLFIAVYMIVTWMFEMRLLGSILDQVVSVGVIAIIIIFQEEIRRFFLTIGSQRRLSYFVRLFANRNKTMDDPIDNSLLPIVMACDYMSKNLVGALIIIEREMSLTDIVKSGETIDARISAELIKNIFFKNSPLHDGALIVAHGRLEAAGCILPVSHSMNIPKELGLRHRAALGITQQSDALAIIVSEETGAISVAQHGEFHLRLAANELESILVDQMATIIK